MILVVMIGKQNPMTKLIIAIPIIFLIGCSKNETHNVVEYKGIKCKSLNDVGIEWDGSKYKCVYSVSEDGKEITIKKYDFKNPRWLDVAPITKCETEITNIYKDGAIRCKGKILTGNQKTKIVRINK